MAFELVLHEVWSKQLPQNSMKLPVSVIRPIITVGTHRKAQQILQVSGAFKSAECYTKTQHVPADKAQHMICHDKRYTARKKQEKSGHCHRNFHRGHEHSSAVNVRSENCTNFVDCWGSPYPQAFSVGVRKHVMITKCHSLKVLIKESVSDTSLPHTFLGNRFHSLSTSIAFVK